MGKKYTNWIDYSSNVCPVDDSDLVNIQINNDLCFYDKLAKNLNWETGKITAYQKIVKVKNIYDKSKEAKFIKCLINDKLDNTFNLNEIDYIRVVQIEKDIALIYFEFLVARVEELVSEDQSNTVNLLLDLKEWLDIKLLWDTILYSYEKNGLLLNIDTRNFNKEILINNYKEINLSINSFSKKDEKEHLLKYMNEFKIICIEFFNLNKI